MTIFKATSFIRRNEIELSVSTIIEAPIELVLEILQGIHSKSGLFVYHSLIPGKKRATLYARVSQLVKFRKVREMGSRSMIEYELYLLFRGCRTVTVTPNRTELPFLI